MLFHIRRNSIPRVDYFVHVNILASFDWYNDGPNALVPAKNKLGITKKNSDKAKCKM